MFHVQRWLFRFSLGNKSEGVSTNSSYQNLTRNWKPVRSKFKPKKKNNIKGKDNLLGLGKMT